MPPRDVLIAIAVAVVWGLTFIAIKVGLADTPPLAFSALRFLFAAVPLVLFVRPPKTSPAYVILYGLLIGVGQFGLLYIGIREGFPVGLASLVVQLQAFFTILLAWALRGFIAWSSLAAPAPLLLASIWFEGPTALAALAHPSLTRVLSVFFLAYAGTTFGYGMWSRLLARHPAAAVAPFALLVPIVGMIAGVVVFGEPLDAFELWGAVLVMAGLSVNIFGDRLRARRLNVVG
jgi:O-acetylserine/cysteine efflux transporter